MDRGIHGSRFAVYRGSFSSSRFPSQSGSNARWLAERGCSLAQGLHQRESLGSVGRAAGLGFFEQGPPVGRLHRLKIPVPHLEERRSIKKGALRPFPVSASWRRGAGAKVPPVIAESSCTAIIRRHRAHWCSTTSVCCTTREPRKKKG